MPLNAAAAVLKWVDVGSELHTRELALRHRILRAPLGLPPGSEVHSSEDTIWHLVAVQEVQVVGCVLLLPDAEQQTGQLLQMAVDPLLQGQGMGRKLVLHLEERAAQEGFSGIVLHARQVASVFYQKLGYVPQGDFFEEVGIPHQVMTKDF
jgi:predicted GNAT family N-acyltransferase